MLVTMILAVALTTQAAQPQTPQNEQQRLKALAAKIHRESLARTAKAKPKPATPVPPPIVQYVEIAEPQPGSVLYLWSSHLARMPVSAYLSDIWRLQPLILADDEKGIAESQASRREPYVASGTAVRVIQLEKGSGTLLPACEVRILEGPFKDQKGWVLEYLLRERVEVNLQKAKRRH